MAAPKRKSSLILFLWPATLFAAFFFGRLTLTNDPAAVYQAALEASAEKSKANSYAVKKLRQDPEVEDLAMIIEGVSDPLLKIRSAINESDPLKRMSMLTDAFSNLTKDNIMEGLALLESIEDGRLQQQMKQLLLNTWGKLDGPAAMEYVLSQESDEGGRGGRGGRGTGDRFGGGGGLRDTMAVMSGWAETDPRAAVSYASENGADDRGRNTMLMSALQGWANTDIEGAVNYAMTQTTTTTNDQGRGRGGNGGMENFLINRFVNEDPQAATQWAMSQTDPEVRNDAIASTARSLANSNPEDAALWAESISDPDAQAEALRGTASGWAREDPEAALDWARSIEDSSTSNQAVTSALSTWAREDPYSASDYVINMEAGADKDSAAATLSKNLVRQDPEMALLWAESISDPGLQMETISPLTDGWMRKDPVKATEWIQSSSLSEETKQALLTPKPAP
ncbi:MAG: hypothetical protein O7C75_02615 [Verrucomicrobia bacterium]|nr:hypothetical protein [Verrucomicrobiota bacterium]